MPSTSVVLPTDSAAGVSVKSEMTGAVPVLPLPELDAHAVTTSDVASARSARSAGREGKERDDPNEGRREVVFMAPAAEQVSCQSSRAAIAGDSRRPPRDREPPVTPLREWFTERFTDSRRDARNASPQRLAVLPGALTPPTAVPLRAVDDSCRASAETVRSRIARGLHDPADFVATLLRVPATDRDAWLDTVLGLDEIPDDGPELPRGCVPYIPCPVDALLRIVQQAQVEASDVFVDLGSGVGRAAVLVHLLTGAKVIGIEIQTALVVAARALAARVSASHVEYLQGDAATLLRSVDSGSVFFLYCPFTGDRLAQVLAALEDLARTKTIRICCVDLPLPPCPWLSIEGEPSGDLVIYRSQ